MSLWNFGKEKWKNPSVQFVYRNRKVFGRLARGFAYQINWRHAKAQKVDNCRTWKSSTSPLNNEQPPPASSTLFQSMQNLRTPKSSPNQITRQFIYSNEAVCGPKLMCRPQKKASTVPRMRRESFSADKILITMKRESEMKQQTLNEIIHGSFMAHHELLPPFFICIREDS